MTDISMAQRSRSGRGVFADTGDQLLNYSFNYGDPVAIPRPYDSGAMGWAIALRKIAHGLRTHVEISYRPSL